VETGLFQGLTLLVIAAGPAAAQPSDERRVFEPCPPSMQLTAPKTVKVPPDELIADRNALGTAPSVVTAQRQVNSVGAKDKALTDKAAGIKVAFQSYSVTFIDEKPRHWVAQQTVEMRGGDSEAVLALVGKLQAEGLSLGNLDSQVSPDRADKAHQAATIDALHSLWDQATEAGRGVGLEVDHFQHVGLEGETPRPIPMMRGGGQMAARVAMPAPVSTPEVPDITATVSADVSLRLPKAERSQTP